QPAADLQAAAAEHRAEAAEAAAEPTAAATARPPVVDARRIRAADLGHPSPPAPPSADSAPVASPPDAARSARRRPPVARRARRRPRTATAPAPINGPRSPRRAGVIRAPRLNDSAECSPSASCAELKNVAPKPSATDPPQTTRSRSSRLHTDATAVPTRRPVRCMISYVGSVGGRPVIARIDGPDASASRQPRDPQAQRRPLGSTTMWPTWPALPLAPSSSWPLSTIPPPTPVDTTIARKFSLPCAAPSQPSANARALASRSA